MIVKAWMWRYPYPQAALLLFSQLLLVQSRVAAQSLITSSDCDSAEYFGICDPFVPGTIIGGGNYKAVLVYDTWPDGPAERAGICPGDQIVSVNGVSSFENTMERMLREIVSDRPTSITIKVRRANAELEFVVPRVRESTLAFLSHRIFLKRRAVPLLQSSQGVEQVEGFEKEIRARYGWKRSGWFECPLETPEEQLIRFRDVIRRAFATGRLSDRRGDEFSGTVRAFEKEDQFSPGFSALLMKNPYQAWVQEVLPFSPAHHSGLFPGDQLLGIDGREISGMNLQVLTKLILLPNDRPKKMQVSVRRGDHVLELELETVPARIFLTRLVYPVRVPSKAKEETPIGGGHMLYAATDYVLGLWVLYSDEPREVLVENVEYPSPAFDVGFQVGDRIEAINEYPIAETALEALEKLLSPTGPSELLFQVRRQVQQLEFRAVPALWKDVLARIGRRPTPSGSAPLHCTHTLTKEPQ